MRLPPFFVAARFRSCNKRGGDLSPAVQVQNDYLAIDCELLCDRNKRR
jgi:hypothetical protein